jgi:hypothetical protein
MVIFAIGVKILLSLTFLFFFLFFLLCLYWAKEWHPERSAIIGFLVSIFYTFWFFLGGVLILALFFLFLKYLSPTIKIWKFPF